MVITENNEIKGGNNQMAKVLTHSVFIKRGAVNPRNQKNVVTAVDRQRFYASKAAKQGQTLVELKAEIQEFNRKRKLLGY